MLEPIPSAASGREKLVAIEKEEHGAPSAVNRIAVGSQPAALTTTTAEVGGRRPGGAHRVKGGEVAQVGRHSRTVRPRARDALDRIRVDVHGDHVPAPASRAAASANPSHAGAQHAHRAATECQSPVWEAAAQTS
jgi:hypothetical protein